MFGVIKIMLVNLFRKALGKVREKRVVLNLNSVGDG